MKNIKIEVSQQELLLAITLMSDQLFRREFIDPKMPGYKADPSELAMGKDLVLRLRALVKQASETSAVSGTRRAASHLSAGSNGIPDAV
jgi:hypothetical protein